jgi:peptidoglycan/xylan/chitin deacetylase (PgdA/CDA1 family)
MRGYLVASLIAAALGCAAGCGSSASDAPVTVDESPSKPGEQPSIADASTSPAADDAASDAMTAEAIADTMTGADAGAMDSGASPDDASVTPPADTGVAPPVDSGAPSPACGAPPAEPPSLPVAAPPGGTPMIAHWEKPVAGNVVALTFDDGPNPATTNSILDTLKANGIRATFFLNSRVRSDLRTDAAAKATIVRIVSEGHVIGNHTAHHLDLSKESAASIESELKMLEDDLAASVPCAPHLSLVRAPFGEPYLSGSDAAQKLVYPIVWKHGVHIGWSIESLDYTCPATNTGCVVNRVMERIDAGRRGPILMHDTEPVTAAALPTLITELKKRGVTFVTAEKLVRDKYGKPSADLVSK